MVRGAGLSSDDDCGIVEPRVGPSFQAEVPAFFDGNRGTAGTGRHDDVLLWHPNAAAPEVVDVFLRQAEQAIGDPRLVGSVPELALEALYQAGGEPQRASDALTSLESQHAAVLWSEEETAELQDSVTAHGTNLRRVHAGIANLSTRSFPECVSQHARSVEKRPLLTSLEPMGGGGRRGGGQECKEAGRPRAIPTESDGAGAAPQMPHPIQMPPTCSQRPHLSCATHRYFLTCYTREADDEQVDGLRPRARHRSGESPSAERAGRITRLPSDPTMMLASLLSAGMLEAGRAVRCSTRARSTASAHLPRPHPP